MKILHRLLPTQKYLHIIKEAESPNCTFCKNDIETIPHLLWHSSFTKRYWKDVNTWLCNRCTHLENFKLSENFVIFGHIDDTILDPIFELIILLSKYHIFNCKTSKSLPNLIQFKNLLAERYNIEKARLVVHNGLSIAQFENNWRQYSFINNIN